MLHIERLSHGTETENIPRAFSTGLSPSHLVPLSQAWLGARDVTTYPGTTTTTLNPLARYDREPGTWDMILVAETASSEIAWAERRDLEFDRMSFRINVPDRPSISSQHRGGANVLLRQASSGVFVPNDTSPKLIEAILTVDGPERFPDAPLWLPTR